MKRIVGTLLGLVLFGALVAACGGGDDGAGVRTLGCDESGSASGTSSGSGSGSASGSASCPSSGSGSGSASGSGVAVECEPVGDISTATTTVDVTLDEWVIDVAAPDAPAGRVGFKAANRGTEPHELLVLKGVDAAAMPLDDNGALDEEKLPDGALIGEIEPFPAGETCDGVFELDPAEYVLVCDITEVQVDGTVESHVKKGMLTTFTVT